MPRNELDIEMNQEKPEEMREWVISLGYTPDTWSDILAKRTGSHQLRAAITIAQGTEPRVLRTVINEIRKTEGIWTGELG